MSKLIIKPMKSVRKVEIARTKPASVMVPPAELEDNASVDIKIEFSEEPPAIPSLPVEGSNCSMGSGLRKEISTQVAGHDERYTTSRKDRKREGSGSDDQQKSCSQDYTHSGNCEPKEKRRRSSNSSEENVLFKIEIDEEQFSRCDERLEFLPVGEGTSSDYTVDAESNSFPVFEHIKLGQIHTDTAPSQNEKKDLNPKMKNEKVTLHPRKRPNRLENHKRTIAKKNVERGNEHKTANGRLIAAKKFEGQKICKCDTGCCEKIDIMRQKQIFENFYKTSNWTQKTLLIRSTVKIPPAPLKFDPIIPLKVRQNFQYTLENADGISHIVCRDFYIKCLNLTPSRIQRALKTAIKNPSADETRGRGPPAIKTSEQDRRSVINFINLFPKFESHYSREKTTKKYLHPNLNLKKLYDEYKSSCESKKENPVSHYIFSEIFNNNFNLGFKRLHTDTCKICCNSQCSAKASGTQEEIAEISRKQLKHIESVEYVQKEFKQDVNNAESNGTSIVLTFDLQKTLETPALTTSVAYYKRPLWTYNLCVYDEVNKKGYMYVWNESIASRGGQEIGSCLINHLKNNVPSSTENVILYSDSCGGQNRNIKIALLLKHFLASSQLKSITQKYFISGHSYNSCDRCFSLIEKYKKKVEIIATPGDWIKIIKEAKKSEPKFDVKEMKTPDFFSSKELERQTVNREVDLNGHKIDWFCNRKIIQEKSNVFQLTLFDGNAMQVVNLKKRGVREEDLETLELPCLYPEGKAITKSKYLDLQQLMCFIPLECRQFFENLNYENKEDVDYGFSCDESDIENV